MDYVRKDTSQDMINIVLKQTGPHLLTLNWSEYLRHVNWNPLIYLALKLVHGKGVENKDRGNRVAWILI